MPTPPVAPGAAFFARPVQYAEQTLSVVHSLDYRYPRPVRDVVTRLRLFPPARRGTQRVVSVQTRFAPLPNSSLHVSDAFGNDVWELHHESVHEHLTLVVTLEVINGAFYTEQTQLVATGVSSDHGCPTDGLSAFLAATPLTTPNVALAQLAHDEQNKHEAEDPVDLAFSLCRRVYAEMRYTTGVTTVRTTAAEAWEMRRGVCQDYAHILIALCRLQGIPARYASGFLPGEGAMHAWVEVLLPQRDFVGVETEQWVALDPTHQRWVNQRYITVAVGRDYHDVTPTSGTYYGNGPGVLSHKSKVVASTPSYQSITPQTAV